MAIAEARPGVVLVICALVAGVVTPVGVWQWMAVHKSSLEGLTVSASRAGAVQLDSRWTLVALGVLVAVSYSALAGIALVLSRRARRPFRNAITLAMLPVFFALAWVAVMSPR